MILRLFRSLMPKDHSFVLQLTRHAHFVEEGAGAFRAFLGGDDTETHYAALRAAEEAADDVTKGIIQGIHRSFITPFDRSQILDLTTALDDTVDLMKETARRLRLYGVAFTPEMLAMADCAVEATAELHQMIPLLDAIGRNVDRLTEIQLRVRAIESRADGLLEVGLRNLFASDVSAGTKLTVEKVYDLIESIVDRCEDVADVIEGIVVEQV